MLGRGRSAVRTGFLDTETTGLQPPFDELLEVALLDDDGNVLFTSLVKPSRRSEWPEATAVHGIEPAEVQRAPSIDDILPALAGACSGVDLIVAYNAAFDGSFLPSALHQAVVPKMACAMEAFALYRDVWLDDREDFKFHRLQIAAEAAGHVWEGRAHRAQSDAAACRSVWRFLLGLTV